MLLLTPSLYNSFHYSRGEFGEFEEFLATLRKDTFVGNELTAKGEKWEKDVMEHAKGQTNMLLEFPYKSCVAEAAARCHPDAWQVALSKAARIRDMDFLIYCRADNINKDRGIDLKYTENYDVGKYFYSVQHQICMFAGDLPRFDYIITNGTDVYEEEYARNDDLMFSRLHDLVGYIFACPEMRALYTSKWQTKY